MKQNFPAHSLISSVFSLSDQVRYVAVYQDGQLTSSAKQEVENGSSSESDKYEELIVNPALLTLVRQRGNIDCGGAQYILVRYGNFFELIAPIQNGHISICIEPGADPISLVGPLEKLLPLYK